MQSKHISLSLLITILLLLLGSGGYTLTQIIQNYSPAKQVINARELALLSGSYSFRSDVDQRTAPAPQMGNYGQPAKHIRMRIEGSADEAKQTAEVVITNITAEGESSTHIRRARGHTFVMQADGTWREANTSAVASQLSGLTYLAGMRDVTHPQTNQYAFGFDGKSFAAHLSRLLDADMAHGVTYDSRMYQAALSEQLIASTGNGQLIVDQDGLPANISFALELPATAKDRAAHVDIKTVFFDYARTGLALQAAMHQPLYILSKYIGTDARTVRDWLLITGSLGILLLLVVLLQLFGRRMYLPVTMVVVAMTIYQPYSTIPRTQAATNSSANAPTPAPVTPNAAKSAPKLFNPLIAPLDQPMGVVLPTANVTSPSNMRVVHTKKPRVVVQGTSTDCSALTAADKSTDSDGDGLSNALECAYGTNLVIADTDTDGLTDLEEIRLGTFPSIADTDSDGLSDYAEVKYYTQYPGSTQKYYTSPISADTNGDGINDSIECTAKFGSDGSSNKDTPIATLQAPCVDANLDNVPDFLSFDNDGDGVADDDDLTPNDKNDTVFSDINPYQFRIDNLPANNAPITVDFQIRPFDVNPADQKLLYANNAIYDWPTNDSGGNIKRVKDTTFATTTSTDIVTPTESLNPLANDVNSQHGDIRVSGYFEVHVPIGANQFGNLPIKSSMSLTNNPTINPIRPAWVDMDKLRPYNISVGWSRDAEGNAIANELTVSLPLRSTTDGSGSIVAYNATMYYSNNYQLPTPATSSGIWGSPHQYRVQWVISSLQDACPATKTTCTTSERIESVKPLYSYYSNWKLTGVTATEQRGVDVAIIYEDATRPTITDATNRRKDIQKLSSTLDEV
ncbi:MAG: hypothetical protein NT020_09445 [Chloroflexales bacterium]|nr:hypothetical protein [Chloroflexales bacterium]